jgi:hypothetical protein
MAHAQKASKRKRRSVLPALGVAGMFLSLAGGASAAVAPATHVPSQDRGPRPAFLLGEEEISDVSLATFYVYDRGSAHLGYLKLAKRCGRGVCRGRGG